MAATEYSNELSGALFKNDKGDNPKRPDYKGNVTIEGNKYWVASWIQKDKSGRPYMSLKLELADVTAEDNSDHPF